jgi:hypothetical protein
LPIILATGFGGQDKIARAEEIGIRECLEKPIPARDLDKIMRQMFDGYPTS